MSSAIGNVNVQFTASALGLVQSVNQSNAALDSLRSQQVAVTTTMTAAAARTQAAQARSAMSVNASSNAMRDAARIAREVRTPAEKYADTVAKLDNYLARGLLTQEVYTRAVDKARASLDATASATAEEASSASRLATAGSVAERTIRGLSDAVQSLANSVGAVAEAGSSVIKLGEQAVGATVAWRVFKAVSNSYTSPEGLVKLALGLGRTVALIRVAEAAFGAFGVDVSGVADFTTKASVAFALFKGATASGLTTAGVSAFAANLNTTYGITTKVTAGLRLLGVSSSTTAAGFALLGTAGTAVGGILTRLAAFSIPGFGQLAAATYFTVKAFFASRDAAYETAAAVAALTKEGERLGVTFQDLQIQKSLDAGRTREDIARLGLAISALDATHFDDLAFANERFTKASSDTRTVMASLGVTLSSTFVGTFAAISDGMTTLTQGFNDLVSGVNALAAPLAQVIRPFATTVGTVVQAALQLAGVIGSLVGVTLRFAGVLLQAGLSPFIVGLNNTADAIRSGVGAAFDWLGSKVEGLQKRVTAMQNALAQLPVIGKVFASTEGRVVAPPTAPQQAVQNAAAAKAAAEEDAAAMRSVTDAIKQQEQALSSAIASAQQYGQAGFDAALQYQEQLRALNAQLEAGILNETSYAAAAKAAKESFDEQVSAIRERNKAAEDIGEQIAKAQDAGKALGAAADDVRDRFRATAEAVRDDLTNNLIGPEEARKRMADAVAGMNDELQKLGEDQRFAERIRESLKTAGQKLREELDAIDANPNLTADEKDKAKAAAREKAKAGLPGAERDDPVAKFREQVGALRAAMEDRVIGQQEVAEREARLREELNANVADFRDQRGRNAGPDRRENKAAEVNSSEGVATFFRLMRGEDDPTAKQLAEAQKQTKLLERVNEALAEPMVVEI